VHRSIYRGNQRPKGEIMNKHRAIFFFCTAIRPSGTAWLPF